MTLPRSSTPRTRVPPRAFRKPQTAFPMGWRAVAAAMSSTCSDSPPAMTCCKIGLGISPPDRLPQGSHESITPQPIGGLELCLNVTQGFSMCHVGVNPVSCPLCQRPIVLDRTFVHLQDPQVLKDRRLLELQSFGAAIPFEPELLQQLSCDRHVSVYEEPAELVLCNGTHHLSMSNRFLIRSHATAISARDDPQKDVALLDSLQAIGKVVLFRIDRNRSFVGHPDGIAIPFQGCIDLVEERLASIHR